MFSILILRKGLFQFDHKERLVLILILNKISKEDTMNEMQRSYFSIFLVFFAIKLSFFTTSVHKSAVNKGSYFFQESL